MSYTPSPWTATKQSRVEQFIMVGATCNGTYLKLEILLLWISPRVPPPTPLLPVRQSKLVKDHCHEHCHYDPDEGSTVMSTAIMIPMKVPLSWAPLWSRWRFHCHEHCHYDPDEGSTVMSTAIMIPMKVPLSWALPLLTTTHYLRTSSVCTLRW